MILIRNIFQLKVGKAKEAKVLFEQMNSIGDESFPPTRILTDVTGPFYQFILEHEERDLASWEAKQSQTLGNPLLRPLFEQFYSIVESGRREIYKIEDIRSGARLPSEKVQVAAGV